MNQRRIALFGLLASVAAFAVPAAPARAQAPAPIHIAVVNLREAYYKLAETKELQTHLAKMQEDFASMQKLHKDQLDDFQRQINNLKAESTQHGDMMEKLDDTQLDYKRQEALQQVKMVRAQNHEIISAFKAIQAAVADIAKKRGYDLVLVNSDSELPENAGDIANQETVGNLIFGRNVLYVSDKVNITADVVAAVDAAHASAAAPPAVPAK